MHIHPALGAAVLGAAGGVVYVGLNEPGITTVTLVALVVMGFLVGSLFEYLLSTTFDFSVAQEVCLNPILTLISPFVPRTPPLPIEYPTEYPIDDTALHADLPLPPVHASTNAASVPVKEVEAAAPSEPPMRVPPVTMAKDVVPTSVVRAGIDAAYYAEGHTRAMENGPTKSGAVLYPCRKMLPRSSASFALGWTDGLARWRERREQNSLGESVRV